MILTVVLDSFANKLPVNITSLPCLHTLLTIRYLNHRKKQCNYVTIARFLKANYRTLSDNRIELELSSFESAGYIVRRGTVVTITELGRSVLNDIEYELRTSHYRFKKSERVKFKIPGPKKGCSKPVQFLKSE